MIPFPSEPAPPASSCLEPIAEEGPSSGGCSLPEPSSITGEAKWFSILQGLQPGGAHLPAAECAALLREALASAKSDERWNASGVPELLARSLELVSSGQIGAACSTALGLLDFHFLVERYRSTARSCSSGSTDSAGKRTNDDGTSAEVESPGPAVKRARTACETGSTAPATATTHQLITAGPATASVHQSHHGTFALPAKPAPRNITAANAFAAPAQQAQRRSSARPVTHPVTWTGEVFQEMHGRHVTYAMPLSIDLPIEHATEVGDVIEVAQIAPRKGIKLGEHYVCKCSLPPLSRSQTAKLKSLAQHELVLVAPQPENGLILVPYLGNSGDLKMVAFYVLVPACPAGHLQV